MAPHPKTVAFIGASGGVGLAALRQTLAAGYHCIALARDPSKITGLFPDASAPRHLSLVKGNAHDVDAVAQCLVVPGDHGQPAHFVDVVVSSIGGKMLFSKMTLDDPNVCEKGMAALLKAISQLRARGVMAKSSSEPAPRIVAVSTTGISKHGRDVPLAFMARYHGILRVPHADKRAMEDRVVSSGEMFTIVRPSLLTNDQPVDEAASGGSKDGKKTSYQSIRVGIEDPVAGCRISSAVGYTISRADAGRWIVEHLVLPDQLADIYARKIATVTY